jgi:hypothetical protein
MDKALIEDLVLYFDLQGELSVRDALLSLYVRLWPIDRKHIDESQPTGDEY